MKRQTCSQCYETTSDYESYRTTDPYGGSHVWHVCRSHLRFPIEGKPKDAAYEVRHVDVPTGPYWEVRRVTMMSSTLVEDATDLGHALAAARAHATSEAFALARQVASR